MLECIKFGDDKVKTIQIGNKWFVAVRDILIVSSASPDTLKGIVHNNLPHQYKCSIKEIGISGSYYGSKFFTVIPTTCRLILVLIHLTFLLKGISIYKIKPGKHRKQSMWYLTIA